MIVELSGTDLLRLANEEQVAIGDLIIRPGAESKIIGSVPAFAVAGRKERSAEQISRSRSNARAAVTKTGQRWMNAIYPGGCAMNGCPNAWKKGALILYDYDSRRALCEGHGEAEFPNIPKPQEVTT